jgi:nicotinate phosphoribosyltransferase
VRLDSGDLVALSRSVRRILDDGGLGAVTIFASGGLDEHEVAELVHAGAPVDAFGIGTQLGVSFDAPALDTVYKLVEYDGRPAMKLSAAKASPPGAKQVWRCPDDLGDVLGVADETGPVEWEPLLEPVMVGGRLLRPHPRIENIRTRFDHDLAALPIKAKRLVHAERVTVRHSEALAALTEDTREDARAREGLPAESADG